MKLYIVVTKKLDTLVSNMLEESIDKIEIFKNAEDAVCFYEENRPAEIITRELEDKPCVPGKQEK